MYIYTVYSIIAVFLGKIISQVRDKLKKILPVEVGSPVVEVVEELVVRSEESAVEQVESDK